MDQHPLQEEFSPAAAEEAADSPEDNTGTVAPPEYLMPDDTKGAELQDVETPEPLPSDQEEATKVEAAGDETGPAEISPEGTPEEIHPTGALDGISAEDGSQITAIPPEAVDDTDTDATTDTEEHPLGFSTEEDPANMFETEETSQEEAASQEPAVEVPGGLTDTEDDQEDAALEQFASGQPAVEGPGELTNTDENQEEAASQEPAVEVPGEFTTTEEDQEEALPAVLSESDEEEETSEPAAEDNTEVAPTDEEPPPSVLAEDESDVSPALDAPLEPADDETAEEKVVVLSDNSEEELEEMIPKVAAESAHQEASEEQEQLETEENSEQDSPDSIILLEEDETVVVISDVDEESQEDPVATVLSTVEGVEEMAQEEENLSALHQEGSEGTEVETEEVPTTHPPIDGGASVEEEEDAIIISNADEDNQEGAATSSSSVEESEEVLEETLLSVSTEVFHQEPSKETEVETKVISTPNVLPAAPEEDQTLASTFDLDKDSHQKAAEELAAKEPAEEPVPEDLVLIVVLEDRGENSESIQSELQPEEAGAEPEDTEASELVVSRTAAAIEVEEPGEVQVPRSDSVIVPVLSFSSSCHL